MYASVCILCFWIFFITDIQLSYSLEIHNSYKCFTFCLSTCYKEAQDFRFCQLNCRLNTYPTNTCLGDPSKATQEPQLDIPVWKNNESLTDVVEELKNPQLIRLEWDPVDRAQIYVLEHREIVDNSTSEYQLHETPATKLKFLKPDMCAEHEFRVAAVNDKQFGNFSELFHVWRPVPEFYKFNLKITDMELKDSEHKALQLLPPYSTLETINFINEDADQPKHNFIDFVKITIIYYWPPKLKELLDSVDIRVHLQAMNKDVCKYSKMYKINNSSNLAISDDNNTVSEEYLLRTNISLCQYTFYFFINKVKSKCGTEFIPSEHKYKKEYSTLANVSCNTVQNAKCPKPPKKVFCRVDEFSSEYNRIEGTFKVKWTYNSTTSTKPDGFLYHIGLIEYNTYASDPFSILNTTNLETNYISVQPEIDFVNVSIPLKASIGKSYFIRICESYGNDSHHEINWKIVTKYFLNGSNGILFSADETKLSDGLYISELSLFIGIGILSCILLNFLVIFLVTCWKKKRAIVQPLRDFEPSIIEDEKNAYILNTFSKL